MQTANYTAVRNKFKDYCDKATKGFETIIITRERGENVVLMSEAEYYSELMQSVKQLKKGKGRKRELVDE